MPVKFPESLPDPLPPVFALSNEFGNGSVDGPLIEKSPSSPQSEATNSPVKSSFITNRIQGNELDNTTATRRAVSAAQRSTGTGNIAPPSINDSASRQAQVPSTNSPTETPSTSINQTPALPGDSDIGPAAAPISTSEFRPETSADDSSVTIDSPPEQGPPIQTVSGDSVEQGIITEPPPESNPVSAPSPTATQTPEPEAIQNQEPAVTQLPEPTSTQTPDLTPEATQTPEPATQASEPEAIQTPEPTPEPPASQTPEPTTPEPPAQTLEPEATQTPALTPEATQTLEPATTQAQAPTKPEPPATQVPEPTTDPAIQTPEPEAIQTPELTPEPASTQTPELTPEPATPEPAIPTPESITPEPPATQTPRFNYGEALQKSFLFYEAQRSGALPEDNRIAWRGDSVLDDGSEVGLDLSGGYFDAGDHVKYNFPMAASMTLLSWGVEQYRSGYEQSGQLDEALAAIRWGTDFLLKSHVVENGETQAFWAQVGDPRIDQQVFELPESINTRRPAYQINAATPGTDLAAEVAASLASASIIFRPTDSVYADELLENAQQLYSFADNYRGSYVAALPSDSQPYRPIDGFQDELAWGAAWIHKAIKAQGGDSQAYLTKAEAEYSDINLTWTQDWDNKSQGAAILLAQETGTEWYREDVNRWLGNWMPGGTVDYTEGGLAWLHGWGSLRLSANTAFLAGVYADTVEDPNGAYSQFAEQQIDYILGDNPRGSSYVVGFGDNSPQRVHHQAAAQYLEDDLWNSNLANTNIIYGALVGGPSAADDFAYQDDRNDFHVNEVGLDYNAGYTGALARLYSHYGGDPLSDRQLHDLPGIEIAAISNAPTFQP